MTSSPVPYRQHAENHARSRDEIARLSTRISTFRLISFLTAAASFISTMRGAAVLPIAIMVVSILVFGVLVVWHARVDDRIAWHEALRVVNMRGLARVARDWDALPAVDPPPGVDLSNHPFAVDLDLFGRASLSHWLGPTTTPRGRATLANWLLFPARKDEIIERQEAVARLAPLDDWRANLSAYGVLVEKAREVEIARFVAWAEGDDPFARRLGVLQAIVLTITGVLWLLIAAAATGAMEAQLWPIPLLLGIVLSFAYANRITTTLDRAGGGEDALSRYASVFEHAVTVPTDTRRLRALLDRLSAGGVPAPRCMRYLNRILGFGELRRGAAILHFPIQALTLWDFYVIFALERWRRTCGTHVRAWLETLGELDALAVLATARRDNPEWAVPDVHTVPQISAQAIGHPLIPDSRRVANDVVVGPPGTLLLVTGSNMSGKSTLLRAIGLNIVLAQAGACVCARQMSLPESDLQTSIRVQDSLERGMSYFMAALARLKGVVDAAEQDRTTEGRRVLVYLLDEILQGTNSAERSVAVRAVARHLLKAGAIGAMTTHDLSLAEEEPLKTAAHCWHFSETLDERGAMHFDYKLKPGLATSRNALRLMQMIGIDL